MTRIIRNSLLILSCLGYYAFSPVPAAAHPDDCFNVCSTQTPCDEACWFFGATIDCGEYGLCEGGLAAAATSAAR